MNDLQNTFNKNMIDNGLNIKSYKNNQRNNEISKTKKVETGVGTTVYANMNIIPDTSGQEIEYSNDETLEYFNQSSPGSPSV